jgi:hypothetical protein
MSGPVRGLEKNSSWRQTIISFPMRQVMGMIRRSVDPDAQWAGK